MEEKDFASSEYTRTDLALELHGNRGATQEEKYPLSGHRSVTVTRQDGDDNKYVTFAFDRITELGQFELDSFARLIADELVLMASELLKSAPDTDTRILAVGLGNAFMTSDAIGPHAAESITATRHLREFKSEIYSDLGCCELSSFAPGVLGQTGIESADAVSGIASHVKPHLIIAIDALAARSPDRLASTVQLSSGGISPGSGIGNTRVAIDASTMKCPVIAVGVPTVVNSSVLVYDALQKAGIPDGDIGENLRAVLESGKSFIVAPKDADRICSVTSKLISAAVNMAFGIYEG